jgi:hypothetical protein
MLKRTCPPLLQCSIRQLTSFSGFPIVSLPFSACHGRYVSTLNPLPTVDTQEPEDNSNSTSGSGKVWDAIKTTTATLACVGIAGYGYHRYYKWLTLKKIENAFKPGDPALDLIPRVIGKPRKDDGGIDDKSHWVTRLYI